MWTRSSTVSCGVALVLLHCTAQPATAVPDLADTEPASESEPFPMLSSLDPALLPDAATPDSDCAVPQPRPIPERSDCSPLVFACEPSPDTCLFTPLAKTLGRLLREDCAVYCGELAIGLHQGCITLVEGWRAPGECIEAALLGSRWDCAPDDGMVRVYLGSCTIL